jgi:hypothetical protein
MLNTQPKQVHDQYYDRQWDGRFNVQTDESLSDLLTGIKSQYEQGKLQYILVGGVEVGTRPYQDDYQVKHVHVAAIFNNRVSKRSILTNWNIKSGNGYYLVPRNRDLPYSGWRSHHIKEFSKVDKTKPILFEMGTLPQDQGKKNVQASEEEKKRKIDEVLIEMKSLIENNKEDEAFKKFPRNYLTYGEKIKAMVTQKRDFFKTKGNPHIWLHGYPGTGKTAVLSLVYPDYYKKNLSNKFFDLYDPKVHSHVMLEDLDHEAMERLGTNFVKTICDEAGFPIDQKYKTPQLCKTTCLVTSNFLIGDLLKFDEPGYQQNCAALSRRFWVVNVYELLRLLGIKLLPSFQRNILKKEGNTDVSKLFISWDYLTDMPTCTPLRKPEDYQEIIRNAFYK